MCRIPTPTEEREACSRCGCVRNPNDGWEHGWPLFGKIDIGFHSCAGHVLTHGRHGFPAHPAMTEKSGPQRVVFEWGDGGVGGYSSRNGFRLCEKCQRDLIATIGEWFGLDHGPYVSDYEWWEKGNPNPVKPPRWEGFNGSSLVPGAEQVTSVEDAMNGDRDSLYGPLMSRSVASNRTPALDS